MFWLGIAVFFTKFRNFPAWKSVNDSHAMYDKVPRTWLQSRLNNVLTCHFLAFFVHATLLRISKVLPHRFAPQFFQRNPITTVWSGIYLVLKMGQVGFLEPFKMAFYPLSQSFHFQSIRLIFLLNLWCLSRASSATWIFSNGYSTKDLL